jgi:ADP-ribosylglycohydrolase
LSTSFFQENIAVIVGSIVGISLIVYSPSLIRKSPARSSSTHNPPARLSVALSTCSTSTDHSQTTRVLALSDIVSPPRPFLRRDVARVTKCTHTPRTVSRSAFCNMAGNHKRYVGSECTVSVPQRLQCPSID